MLVMWVVINFEKTPDVAFPDVKRDYYIKQKIQATLLSESNH
jgi:hypothetical protein